MHFFLSGGGVYAERGEFGNQRFHGESDDVGEGALNACDEFAVVILCGVGAGLVERLDAFELGESLRGAQAQKAHGGAFHKNSLAPRAAVRETDS